MLFHTYIKYVLVIMVATTSAYAIEINNLSIAIDVAGKQRMFTQRMLKDYIMIGMKNKFENPKEDLKNIMTEFNDHLDELIKFNKDKTTARSLEKVKDLWLPIKEVLKESPKKELAEKMQEDLETLLKQANEATGLFAKQTGKKSGEIINIAGRQRMLSQRMASLYMMKAWGIDDPKFTEKMNIAMKLFKDSLEKLIKYENNTPEILVLLHKVEKDFMFFEFMHGSDKFIPTLIFKKSMIILKNMNLVTGLYAKIAK